MGKEKLFDEFPPISTQQWEEIIKLDLKGADYEKKLLWKTNEGIKVKPYYRSDDIDNSNKGNVLPGDFPFIRGNRIENNNWEIREDIEVNDIEQCNKEALTALKSGANSIAFVLKNKCPDKSDFLKLVNGINIDNISFNLIGNKYASSVLKLVLDYTEKKKLNTRIMNGSVCIDPVGELTVSGNWMSDETSDFKSVKALIEAAKPNLPLYKVLAVNGAVFQESGSSVVQETGFSLAIAAEYLNYLTDAGLTIDDIAPRMQFNLAVGSNYFIEIAKLRAFRLLWSKLAEAYKPKNENITKTFFHSTTGKWNMTLYDPFVNMLRATTESMSAIIGGTDSLSVTPFDNIFIANNDFSNRIARNIQIILSEEAYFDRVIDPAAGSYYIENLTNSIAAEAWKLFLKVEKEGGYIACLKKGLIQSEIKTISDKRINDIASRRETLVGTNQYPNFNEQVLGNIEKDVFEDKNEVPTNQVVKPIKSLRGAQAFEKLRLTTEKSGKRPKVFMLTIGSLAMRLARSQFSSNFFALAGFEVIDNNGFDSIEEGVRSALEAKADIVVLCSSDDEYATLAPEAYEKIGSKAIFVVAGAPASMEELVTKGIVNFINIKSNVLEALTFYQKILKIN